MRSVWIAAGLCSALLSCGVKKIDEKTPAPKPPEKVAPVSSQAATAPKVEGPRTDYLVVVEQKGAAGQPDTRKTVWLKATPEGYQELGAHDGVAASDGKAVWFWGDKPSTEKSTSCECANALFEKGIDSEEEMKKCTADKVLPAAAFYDVSQKERKITLRGAPASTSAPSSTPTSAPIDDGDMGGELDGSIDFIASLGPFVFYSESGYQMPCGAAHGLGGTSYSVVDLRDGLSGFPWGAADEKVYTEPHVKEAKAALCTPEMSAEPADGCIEASFAPEVTAIFPEFKEGKVKTIVQYTIPTFYAATDGTSGSYSRSARIPIEPPPVFFKEFSEVPAAVKAYWAKNPPGESTGWSPISGEPTALETLRDSFMKAPSMELKVKGM